MPVSLMLDWYPNADHVGVYVGIDKGFFARAGLGGRRAGAVGRVRPDPARRRRGDRPRHRLRARGVLRPAAARPGRRGGVGRAARRSPRSSRRARAASTRRPTCAARRSASTARRSTTAFVETVLRHAGVSPSQVTLATSASTRCPPCSSTRWTRSPACSRTSRGSSSPSAACTRWCSRTTATACPRYDELVLVANAEPAALRRGLPAHGGAVRDRARSGHPLGAGPPGRRDRGDGAPRLPRLPWARSGPASRPRSSCSASAR